MDHAFWVCVEHHYLNLFLCFQLRERMLTKMTGVLSESPSNTTQEVQVMARAVAGLTQSSDELSDVAQVQYITLQSEILQIIAGKRKK